jgi:hypothetical protein
MAFNPINWTNLNYTDWLGKSQGAKQLQGYAQGTNQNVAGLGNWNTGGFNWLNQQLQQNPTWANYMSVQKQAENLLGGWNNYQGIQNQVANQFAGFGNQQALQGYVNNLSNQLGETAGREFSQNIMPALQAKGVQSGSYGSSRQGIAEALAASEAQKNLSAAISSLQYNAAEAERNRGMQAAIEKAQSLQKMGELWSSGQQAKAKSLMELTGMSETARTNKQQNLIEMMKLLSGERTAKAGLGAAAAQQLGATELGALQAQIQEAIGKGNLLGELGKLGANESQFARNLLFGAATQLNQSQQTALNTALQGLSQYPELVKTIKSMFGV